MTQVDDDLLRTKTFIDGIPPQMWRPQLPQGIDYGNRSRTFRSKDLRAASYMISYPTVWTTVRIKRRDLYNVHHRLYPGYGSAAGAAVFFEILLNASLTTFLLR